MRLSALRGLAMLDIAVGSTLVLVMTAGAASNLQVTFIDCQSHPGIISIQNQGDSPQDLTSWTLRSDQPDEVFDLGVAGTLGAGKKLNVFNGHNAFEEPYYDPGSDTWTYGWNPNDDFDPADFVLWGGDDDYIQIVDAGGKAVSRMLCTGELVTPETPTPSPPPTQPPDTGGDSNTPPTNPLDSPSGDNSQTSDNSVQAVTRSRTTSEEPFGPPAPGTEAPLPDSGGPPLAEQSLPLPLMSILAGVSLLLGGVLVVRRALGRPDQG